MIRSDEEFFNCAVKNYDNPRAISIDEFKSDVRRIGHLETLLRRYAKNKDDLRDRLIMNHIVILGNCFSTPVAMLMVKYKIAEELHQSLETFLYFVGWVDLAKHLDFYLLDKLETVHGRR